MEVPEGKERERKEQRKIFDKLMAEPSKMCWKSVIQEFQWTASKWNIKRFISRHMVKLFKAIGKEKISKAGREEWLLL